MHSARFYFICDERARREREVHKSREPAETDSRFSSGFRVHACTYVKQLSDIMFDFFSLLPSSLIPSIVCISLSFFFQLHSRNNKNCIESLSLILPSFCVALFQNHVCRRLFSSRDVMVQKATNKVNSNERGNSRFQSRNFNLVFIFGELITSFFSRNSFLLIWLEERRVVYMCCVFILRRIS